MSSTELQPIIKRIEAAWSELVDAAGKLGPGGLTLTDEGGWAVKDHLIHVGAWEHELRALLERRDPREAMGIALDPEGPEMDQVNDEVWKLHRDTTPDQAMGYFKDAHTRLMAVLGTLKAEDVERPYSDFRLGTAGDKGADRPIMGWITGNTYGHYAEHTGWINDLAAKRI